MCAANERRDAQLLRPNDKINKSGIDVMAKDAGNSTAKKMGAEKSTKSIFMV